MRSVSDVNCERMAAFEWLSPTLDRLRRNGNGPATCRNGPGEVDVRPTFGDTATDDVTTKACRCGSPTPGAEFVACQLFRHTRCKAKLS